MKVKRVKYDVVATIGKYEKDGQTKYITRKVGSVFETSKGLRLKIDAMFNPAGCEKDESGSVWLALFEPKEKDEQQTTSYTKPKSISQEPAFDDSIPF